MSRIFSVHSFRGGTGKSNTTANLSAMLAQRGLKVGVVDTDIQSPGIHVLFGVAEDAMSPTLNNYLWGDVPIAQCARDVTPSIGSGIKGKVLLVPSSVRGGDIAKILREGYDVGRLNEGFQSLVRDLDLDVLMIDTHPGLNEETLLSIAISDALVLVMRPDQQDYQGTGVTVEIARRLKVPHMFIVVNKTPTAFDPATVAERVSQTYGLEVAAVLPHSDELMVLASAGVFVVKYPDHAITGRIAHVADRLMTI
jgi:septum site-determining protein MinD